jgi:hypothetical protein
MVVDSSVLIAVLLMEVVVKHDKPEDLQKEYETIVQDLLKAQNELKAELLSALKASNGEQA